MSVIDSVTGTVFELDTTTYLPAGTKFLLLWPAVRSRSLMVRFGSNTNVASIDRHVLSWAYQWI
jgi:hypothetical protein